MTTGRMATRARAWRSPWWWLGAVAVSLATVVALPVLVPAVAHGQDDLHALHYGAPVAWAVQDSTLDPPTFPVSIPFGDPHETVTHVLGPRLVLDAALVLALLVGAWSLLALAMGRRPTGSDAGPTTSAAARD
jgi:hypothetical protein